MCEQPSQHKNGFRYVRCLTSCTQADMWGQAQAAHLILTASATRSASRAAVQLAAGCWRCSLLAAAKATGLEKCTSGPALACCFLPAGFTSTCSRGKQTHSLPCSSARLRLPDEVPTLGVAVGSGRAHTASSAACQPQEEVAWAACLRGRGLPSAACGSSTACHQPTGLLRADYK